MKYVAFASLLFASVAGAATITINGSTSMTDLNRRLATEYAAIAPATKIDVVTTDSSLGIAALIGAKADIAASSRAIKPAESAKLERLMAVPVARDAVAVYVNPANGVASLSVGQLGKIFSGEIRNWRELGGPNAPIQLYVREAGSGTSQFFREQALGKLNFAASAKEIKSSGDMIAAIAKDPNGIGFASAVFTRSAKALAVGKGSGAPVSPTRESVSSSAYPLARILYYYLARPPQGELMQFVQWVMSSSGQQSVARAGFFPAK